MTEHPSSNQNGMKLLIKTLIPHPTSERAKTNDKLSNQLLFLEGFLNICYPDFNYCS